MREYMQKLTLYDCALILCGQDLDNRATSHCMEQMLNMLINDVNDRKLEAWWNERSSFIAPFKATKDVANEINIYPAGFEKYIQQVIDSATLNPSFKRWLESLYDVPSNQNPFEWGALVFESLSNAGITTHAIKMVEPKKPILPCESGTRWEDITITLLADDTVSIKTKHGNEKLSYHELGLSDKRKGDAPTMLWEILKLFIKQKGLISARGDSYNPKLPDTAKRLNMHLKKIFGINESIFAGHYKQNKGYRLRFSTIDRTYSNPSTEIL